MIRRIIIPKEKTYTLEIPESFLGKKVEVIAFEVCEGDEPFESPEDKTEKLRLLTEALEGYRIDLADFVFDRDQANDYE